MRLRCGCVYFFNLLKTSTVIGSLKDKGKRIQRILGDAFLSFLLELSGSLTHPVNMYSTSIDKLDIGLKSYSKYFGSAGSRTHDPWIYSLARQRSAGVSLFNGMKGLAYAITTDNVQFQA